QAKVGDGDLVVRLGAGASQVGNLLGAQPGPDDEIGVAHRREVGDLGEDRARRKGLLFPQATRKSLPQLWIAACHRPQLGQGRRSGHVIEPKLVLPRLQRCLRAGAQSALHAEGVGQGPRIARADRSDFLQTQRCDLGARGPILFYLCKQKLLFDTQVGFSTLCWSELAFILPDGTAEGDDGLLVKGLDEWHGRPSVLCEKCLGELDKGILARLDARQKLGAAEDLAGDRPRQTRLAGGTKKLHAKEWRAFAGGAQQLGELRISTCLSA